MGAFYPVSLQGFRRRCKFAIVSRYLFLSVMIKERLDLFDIRFYFGMLSISVNLSLLAEFRGRIWDASGIWRPGDPAPKSRRVWRKSENEVLPLGWVKT